jgi:hypothetical protein
MPQLKILICAALRRRFFDCEALIALVTCSGEKNHRESDPEKEKSKKHRVCLNIAVRLKSLKN